VDFKNFLYDLPLTEVKLNSTRYPPPKKLTSVPPLLDNITRTLELTVLGVTFNNRLSFSQHMQNLTAKAATTLYVLKK